MPRPCLADGILPEVWDNHYLDERRYLLVVRVLDDDLEVSVISSPHWVCAYSDGANRGIIFLASDNGLSNTGW